MASWWSDWGASVTVCTNPPPAGSIGIFRAYSTIQGFLRRVDSRAEILQRGMRENKWGVEVE
jgi:hypothetical protein